MRATYLFSAAVLLLQIHLFPKHVADPLKPLTAVVLPGIEGPIQRMAADVKGQRIFLAATVKDSVEIYDPQTLKHLGSIKGLSQPQDIAFDSTNGTLLVTNGGDGSLRTYDGTTLKLINTKLMGGDADRLRLTADGKAVYVGWGVGSLAIIDLKSGARSDVKLKSHPDGFQLDTTGNRIFVNLPGVQEVAEIDRWSHTVFTSWPVHPFRENGPMALDEANRRIFVVCHKPAKLLVMNMEDGVVTASMSTAADADDVFYDRERKRIYVVGGEGFIAVYRQKGPDEYSSIGSVETLPGARNGLLVPEWNRFFVVARNRPPFEPAELQSFSVVD